MSLRKLPQACGLASILLLVTVLLLGLWFRFANLSNKIFWVDEVATAVRVAGYTIPEVAQDLVQQDIIDTKTLIAYQRLNPAKTFSDTVNALTKSPEHAPLYFVLARGWMELWSESWSNLWSELGGKDWQSYISIHISVLRGLSVWLSLLIFPCLYWLCQELFNRPLVSWLAVMLVSLSPFYVAYAQEARPYSLWTVSILLMGASLLRAIRLNTLTSWLIYSFSLILGMYTSLFSLYVAGFQGVYVVLTLSRRLKVVGNYLLWSLIALLAFTPWLLVIANNLDLLQENTSWMRGNFSLGDITAVLIGTNLLVFGDLPISANSNPIHTAIVLITITVASLISLKITSAWQSKPRRFAIWLTLASSIWLLSKYIYLDWITIIGALVALFILSVSVYAVYYLVANTKGDRWLFVITLILSLPVPLILGDIINQGQSSTAPRYLIPLQLGILLAVAYTLADKLTSMGKAAVSRQRFWRLTLALLLTIGVYSCVRNLNLSPFYQKGRNINNTAIAQVINQQNPALVIVESSQAMDALSMAYSLDPQVKFKVISPRVNLSNYLNQSKNVYILKPSLALKQKLEADTQINFKQVYKSPVFSANEFPLDLWSIDH